MLKIIKKLLERNRREKEYDSYFRIEYHAEWVIKQKRKSPSFISMMGKY